jgi:UV DNA damage endonuclease
MENQLRNDVKRQKMAVKESKMRSGGLDIEHAAFLPRATKSQPDILSGEREKEAMKRRTAEKTGDVEYTVIGGEEGRASPEGEDTERTLNENDINVLKQEGARPPPVNSDYLPLPWKGRLGYVNDPHRPGQVAVRSLSD